MKAVTINISLNPELAEFAREDSRVNAFDSMSEYTAPDPKRRQEEIAADVAFLENPWKARCQAILRTRRWLKS